MSGLSQVTMTLWLLLEPLSEVASKNVRAGRTYFSVLTPTPSDVRTPKKTPRKIPGLRPVRVSVEWLQPGNFSWPLPVGGRPLPSTPQPPAKTRGLGIQSFDPGCSNQILQGAEGIVGPGGGPGAVLMPLMASPDCSLPEASLQGSLPKPLVPTHSLQRSPPLHPPPPPTPLTQEWWFCLHWTQPDSHPPEQELRGWEGGGVGRKAHQKRAHSAVPVLHIQSLLLSTGARRLASLFGVC